MDYATMIRNGYQPAGSYNNNNNMQSYNQASHGHHGYPYPYTNEQLFMLAHMQHQRAMMGPGGMPPSKQQDPKPRLSKDEVDLLEQEFEKNPKPSSGRKREIADMLKVDNPRINNWFQNRRAKEKQIRRTKEFEASQAAEMTTSESNSSDDQEEGTVSEYLHSSNHSRPLHASSAAFPGSDAANQHLHVYVPDQECTLENEVPQLGHSASSPDDDAGPFALEEYPSPKSLPFPVVDASNIGFAPLATGFLPSQSHDFEAHIPSPDGNMAEHSQHQLQDLDACQQQPLDPFAQFTSSITPEAIIAPVPSFPSQLLAAEARIQDIRCEERFDEQFATHTSPELSSHASPVSDDLRFKSPPPPSNIASRRNKGVPAQLNATALRSYSYGPKTGIDMPKRPEGPSPMRRIASATGTLPGRIQKSCLGSAPRSPLYLERTKEALMRSLQSTQTPVVGPLNTALSPVTPSDCPFPGYEGVREATASSSASDDEQRYTLGGSQNPFFRMDTTLKTPPGTPGLQMVALDAAYNYAPQDEPLITPGLGSFGSEEFSMAPSAPGYVASSQPPTPSFPPSVGPTYFPWAAMSGTGAGHTEYTFPGEAYVPVDSSARSSPGQPKSKQFQFTQNITPQDFSAER